MRGPRAIVMGLAAMLALVLLNGSARADEQYRFDLTVYVSASTDEAFAAELERAAVQVDVYRVATAVMDPGADAYCFVWDVDGFSGLSTRFSALAENREGAASDWQAFYDAAARMAPEETVVAHPLSQPVTDGKAEFSLDAKGLYLVVAHASGEGDGPTLEFLPTMVSAPTRWGGDTGISCSITCADSHGDWRDEAAIYLKPAARSAYGDQPYRRVVQTGDETQSRLLPVYILMAFSGIALVALAGCGVIERHHERKTPKR